MTTATTPFPPEAAERKASPLGKLTASGLISIGFCFTGMIILAYHRFEVSAVSFIVLAFALGGIILAGNRRWSPALGAVYCLLFMLVHGAELLHDAGPPARPDFYLGLLLSPILLVTFTAGVVATVQNYRQPSGLWLLHALATAGALSLGILLSCLYWSDSPQPLRPDPSGQSSFLQETLPPLQDSDKQAGTPAASPLDVASTP
jgi:hypothetical protein